MERVLDFVKGHMGKNTILFLYGDQVPVGLEVEFADRVRSASGIASHQVGILRPPVKGGDVAVTIVGSLHQTITMCGGLSQVFGRFIVEGRFGDRFPIQVKEPTTTVILETKAGLVPIDISVQDGEVSQVITGMDCFVEELYQDGVYPFDLSGVRTYRVGKALVTNADTIKQQHPDINIEELDETARRVLVDLQDEFLNDENISGRKSNDFAVYDLHPIHGGDARVVFPHNLRTMHIEPSCGTISVATAIAMYESGEVRGKTIQVSFESGGEPTLGGPEITSVYLKVKQGRVRKASFSHSLIELIAEGKVWI